MLNQQTALFEMINALLFSGLHKINCRALCIAAFCCAVHCGSFCSLVRPVSDIFPAIPLVLTWPARTLRTGQWQPVLLVSQQ